MFEIKDFYFPSARVRIKVLFHFRIYELSPNKVGNLEPG